MHKKKHRSPIALVFIYKGIPSIIGSGKKITPVGYVPLHTGSNRLASNSSKMLHLGARAHGRLVCAAVLSSGGKLGDGNGRLVYEAQLLGVKTLCRRSFSPRRDGDFYNVNY